MILDEESVEHRIYQAATENEKHEFQAVDFRAILAYICTDKVKGAWINQLPIARDKVNAIAVEHVRKGAESVKSEDKHMFMAAGGNIMPKDVEKGRQKKQANPHLYVPGVTYCREISDFQRPLNRAEMLAEQPGAHANGHQRYCRITDQYRAHALIVAPAYCLVEIEITGKNEEERHVGKKERSPHSLDEHRRSGKNGIMSRSIKEEMAGNYKQYSHAAHNIESGGALPLTAGGL